MEEVIAKTVRKIYINAYSLYILFGCLFTTMGAVMATVENSPSTTFMSLFFLILGSVILIFSVCWLIYFIKMPKVAIKLIDGNLHFCNGIVCSPLELEDFKMKSMGLDGSIFSFGKLFITVGGKQFKIKYVDKADAVVKRLFMLKAECSVKEHIAKEQEANKNLQEENNG